MKVTKKMYKEFEAEIRRLQKLLNMSDWKIDMQLRAHNWDGEPMGSANCSIRISADVRRAGLTLNTEIDDFTSIKEICRHEMGHLFWGTLVYIGTCRWGDESEINLEDERMATVFEGLDI